MAVLDQRAGSLDPFGDSAAFLARLGDDDPDVVREAEREFVASGSAALRWLHGLLLHGLPSDRVGRALLLRMSAALLLVSLCLTPICFQASRSVLWRSELARHERLDREYRRELNAWLRQAERGIPMPPPGRQPAPPYWPDPANDSDGEPRGYLAALIFAVLLFPGLVLIRKRVRAGRSLPNLERGLLRVAELCGRVERREATPELLALSLTQDRSRLSLRENVRPQVWQEATETSRREADEALARVLPHLSREQAAQLLRPSRRLLVRRLDCAVSEIVQDPSAAGFRLASVLVGGCAAVRAGESLALLRWLAHMEPARDSLDEEREALRRLATDAMREIESDLRRQAESRSLPRPAVGPDEVMPAVLPIPSEAPAQPAALNGGEERVRCRT